MGETHRNKEWEYRMEIWGLLIIVAVSLIFGAIGWHRYREMKQVKEGLELKGKELIQQNEDLNMTFDKQWRTIE